MSLTPKADKQQTFLRLKGNSNMPAITKIVTRSFTQDDGTITPYKRLAIIGVLNDETHTLEIKLSKAEMALAQALLASTETPITEKELNAEHQEFQQGFES